MIDQESPWLDAKEAALYMGRKAKNSYRTLLRWARAGKIKAGYNGKTFTFRREDLDARMVLDGKKFRPKKS
jgi:hypothetical protein